MDNNKQTNKQLINKNKQKSNDIWNKINSLINILIIY